MIEILLIDHPGLCSEALKQVLSQQKDLFIKNEAFSGMEAIKYIMQEDYDVIILEIPMNQHDGLKIMKQIKDIKPSSNILVLNMNSEIQYGMQAFQEGASGYITQNETLDDFLFAIHKVAEGGKYVSQRVAEKIVTKLDSCSEKFGFSKLSEREYDAMLKIASGESMKKIAEELHVSSSSISTYHRRILNKLGLKNNAELIRYLMEEKIIN